MNKLVSRLLILLVVAGASFGGWLYWRSQQPEPLPVGIVSSNGRIEAVQIDIATKFAGRIKEVLVKEGELVQPDQVVARMDTLQLEASLAQSRAQLAEVEQSVDQAKANIAKAESDVALAEKQATRAKNLFELNAGSETNYDTAQNALAVAIATLGANKAALRTQEFAVKAAEAAVQEIETQLDDAILVAPARGRVLYRLAETGEVLAAGGKVLTILDLTDVHMQIYLPSQSAMRTVIGSEARVVLDGIPQYAGRGKISFVAPEAQFTPKQVETAQERDKLMFRVKVQMPPERAEKYIDRIKTGIRGVAYVRLDPNVAWPEFLETPFPDEPPASLPFQ